METITMLDIRKNARRLVERLKQGECFRITYRNHTVGELHPARQETEISADDPIYSVTDDAESLGGSLGSAEADQLIYDH